MKIDLHDAKARFTEFVRRAAAGETVQILERGKHVATLTGADEPKRPVDLAMLRHLTASMPRQAQSAGAFVRQMRDGDRY